MSEASKVLIQGFVEQAFHRGNLAVIDELVDSEVIVNGRSVGRQGLKDAIATWRSCFADLQVTLGPIVADDDTVGFWYTARGTHSQAFLGLPPTGRRVAWVGFDLWRLAGGKIVECWFVADRLGLAHKLGGVLTRVSENSSGA